MPQVLIACPTSGDLVPTGVDVVTLEQVYDEPGHHLNPCSVCGRDHEWNREEAVLASE